MFAVVNQNCGVLIVVLQLRTIGLSMVQLYGFHISVANVLQFPVQVAYCSKVGLSPKLLHAKIVLHCTEYIV